MPPVAQPKLCKSCGKEGPAGLPYTGWNSTKECSACFVQRRRNDRGVTREYKPRPVLDQDKQRCCRFCGCTDANAPFRSLITCVACYNAFRDTPYKSRAGQKRVRSQLEVESNRKRAREYYWRVKKCNKSGTTENPQSEEEVDCASEPLA